MHQDGWLIFLAGKTAKGAMERKLKSHTSTWLADFPAGKTAKAT